MYEYCGGLSYSSVKVRFFIREPDSLTTSDSADVVYVSVTMTVDESGTIDVSTHLFSLTLTTLLSYWLQP